MSKISVLIIGAGYISREHLKSLIKLKEIYIYGILSRTKKRAQIISKDFHIPNVLTNFNELKKHINNIDMIMICVDADQILKVFYKINNYKKFIFFEKPIGINYRESQKIVKSVNNLRLRTFVGLNRRHYSILGRGIKKLTSNGKKIVSLFIEGNERIWQIKNNPKHSKNIKHWPFINSIHTTDLIRYIGGEINYKTFKSMKSKHSYVATMVSKDDILINYVSNYDYYDGWSIKIYNNMGEYLIYKPLESCSLIKHSSNVKIKPKNEDLTYKPGFRIMHNKLIKIFKSKKQKNHSYDVNDAIKSVELTKKIFY